MSKSASHKSNENTRHSVGKHRKVKGHTVLARELSGLIDKRLADVAAMWPDVWFTAPDGEKFVLLFNGPSILLRLIAMETHNAPSERMEAKVFTIGFGDNEAVICDIGSKEPPLRFKTIDEGFAKWNELRETFGGPPAHSGALECEQGE